MSILKTSNIYDLTGVSGFSFSGGGVTVEGTLTVSTLTVNGAIVGQSSYVLPSQSGSNGKFLSNDGTKLQWKDLSVESGIRSMSVYTGGNTWNKPNGVGTIHVLVTGAGGGGSGFGESGGAGGHSEKVINVQNINSVGITVGSLAVVHTIMVAVVMVTHQVLDRIYQQTAVLVATAHNSTLVDSVDMDLAVN